MNEMPKYAASHEPFIADWTNTTVLSGDVAAAVRKLKEQEGKDIAMFGSNALCVSLMEAGLVDEFRLMVNPVALGKGSPLFTGLSGVLNLKLIATRGFVSGNILHSYIPSK